MKINFMEPLRHFETSNKDLDYATSLFNSVDWIYPLELNTEKIARKLSDTEDIVTEKSVILNEFKNFSVQKLNQSDASKISFDGGEILSKSNEEVVTEAVGQEGLITNLSQVLSTESLNLRFNLNLEVGNKLETPEKVKVMFINDVLLNSEMQINEDGFDNFRSQLIRSQLRSTFSDEVSELFAKMIQAMKLDQNEFVVSGTKVKDLNNDQVEEQDYLPYLFNEILFFKPQILITLGALATHSILKSKERLAKVHGQIFNKKFHKKNEEEVIHVKVMPLFHPELLLINPNMKKTAWIDMQKAMKEIGSL